MTGRHIPADLHRLGRGQLRFFGQDPGGKESSVVCKDPRHSQDQAARSYGKIPECHSLYDGKINSAALCKKSPQRRKRCPSLSKFQIVCMLAGCEREIYKEKAG